MNISTEHVKAMVSDFVQQNFYVPEGDVIGEEDSLLDRGIIDSTGILEVILFLEESYGITVEDGEIVPENLDTIGTIAAFVRRKAGQS